MYEKRTASIHFLILHLMVWKNGMHLQTCDNLGLVTVIKVFITTYNKITSTKIILNFNHLPVFLFQFVCKKLWLKDNSTTTASHNRLEKNLYDTEILG